MNRYGFPQKNIPYARHYKPRLVFIFTHFSLRLRLIIQTIYVLKNGNSSFFKPKIRSLYTRAVTDQEWVIVARVQYLTVNFFIIMDYVDTIQNLSLFFLSRIIALIFYWTRNFSKRIIV